MNDKFDFSLHPISFITDLRELTNDNVILSFSHYVYMPKLRADMRKSFEVSINEVTCDWLMTQLKSLQHAQELALESRLRINGLHRHIPMLDFRGMAEGQLKAIMEIFPAQHIEDIYVYYSGRSFHAYFSHLLTNRQWIKFMGSALLCNTSRNASPIDQRWIGHRLIGGYAALRWSKNTEHYKQFPIRVSPKILDESFKRKRAALHSGDQENDLPTFA